MTWKQLLGFFYVFLCPKCVFVCTLEKTFLNFSESPGWKKIKMHLLGFSVAWTPYWHTTACSYMHLNMEYGTCRAFKTSLFSLLLRNCGNTRDFFLSLTEWNSTPEANTFISLHSFEPLQPRRTSFVCLITWLLQVQIPTVMWAQSAAACPGTAEKPHWLLPPPPPWLHRCLWGT